jgi:peptidoglycan/LPS O-acetylase OafA/YrhL
MYKRVDRAHRAMSLVLGVLTLISLGVLLEWDVNPKFFPARAHGFLAAFPLAMIAIAYLLYQSTRRPSAKEFLKALMLAVAFLFWAANQFWPDLPQATLFNDIAITLFVLDVFLVIIGWPTTSPDGSFAETCIEKP